MNKIKKLSRGVNKKIYFVHKMEKYEQKFDFYKKIIIFFMF